MKPQIMPIHFRHFVKRLGVALGVATLLIAQSAEAVFFTPGQFGVSPTGAANYSIPITLPPGTAGMAPSVAINYNSQGGNGLLGVGWSLSGLSAITRCPKTMAQDGVRKTVQYDASDRYCMDGQRLVSTGGVYGANGTVYRTERESFSRIISYGASGTPATGPAYFTVETKAGLTMVYGNSVDSKIVQQGKTNIQVWALNKVVDSKNNYYTITYQDNSATSGEFYPTSIDYTGNTVTGLLPYNSVRFVYEARPDSTTLYDADGSTIKSTVRLNNIQTYARVKGANVLVKDYRLDYAVSPASKRSRLTTLRECDGVITSATATCLPPTTVGWDATGDAVGNAVATQVQGGAGWNSIPHRYSGDFNGDGKPEMLVQNGSIGTSAYKCAGLDQAATFTCTALTIPSSHFPGHVTVGDFNGDGYDDIFSNGKLCHGPALTACVATGMPAAGGGLQTVPYQFYNGTVNVSANVQSSDYDSYVADVNNDGKLDLIYYQATGYDYVSTAQNSVVRFERGYCLGPDLKTCNSVQLGSWPLGYTASVNWFLWYGVKPPGTGNVTVGDFNADGVSDLLYEAGGNTYRCSGTTVGVGGCSIIANAGWGGALDFLSGDYNGDGISDLFLAGSTASYFCPGPGIATANNCVQVATGDWKSPHIYPGDYNGDGITDLMVVGTGSAHLCAGPGISVASPTDTLLSKCTSKFTGNWFASDLRPGDYDGDGTTDLLLIDDASRKFVETGAGKADRVASFTNGLGASTNIIYKPLTDTTVYIKGTGSVYPVVDIQAPMYVVSNVASSNGIGGTVGTSYNYNYARVHQNGGGFLGFNVVRSCDTNVTPNICTQTTYTQDYPHQGLAKQVLKFVKTGAVYPYLNLVTNTWSYATNTALGAIYHVPQLTQTQEVSYELGSGGTVQGAAITNVTTSNTYDLYGNPTLITVAVNNPATPSVVFIKTTTNTYNNDTVNWYLGRLTGATVTSTIP